MAARTLRSELGYLQWPATRLQGRPMLDIELICGDRIFEKSEWERERARNRTKPLAPIYGIGFGDIMVGLVE